MTEIHASLTAEQIETIAQSIALMTKEWIDGAYLGETLKSDPRWHERFAPVIALRLRRLLRACGVDCNNRT